MKIITTDERDIDAVPSQSMLAQHLEGSEFLFPRAWTVLQPPQGVLALVVDPKSCEGFHANLVVTSTPCDLAPLHCGSATQRDEYLMQISAAMQCTLTDAVLEAIWVTGPGVTTAQQRVVVAHVVRGHNVRTIQHHAWLADEIVVVTATVPRSCVDEDFVSMIDRCLLSFGGDSTVEMVDWEPRVGWSPAPDAVRIAHL